jgi:hypothetical protein
MADQLQLRGGTTAEHASFTGALREITVDTDKDTVVVHDNATVGGHPLQKQYPALGSAAAPTYTFTGDTNTGIYSPGADALAISTNGTGRLFVNSTGLTSLGQATSPNNLTLSVGGSDTQSAVGIYKNGTLYGTIGSESAYLGSGSSNNLFIASFGAGNDVKIIAPNNYICNAGGSERMRLDSSGRLLLGTSSAPTGANSQYARQVIRGNSFDGASTARLGLQFGSTASSLSVGGTVGDIYFTDGSGNDYALIAAARDTSGTSAGRLVFSTTADGAGAPTERMRITSDAYVRLASGTGGIQFNGDTAAANALDDYEEGTWTPTLGGTAVYNIQTGSYTKVGNIVYVYCAIRPTSLGTGSTTTISGLPFSAGGSASGGVSIGYYDGAANSLVDIAGHISTSGPSIILTCKTAASTDSGSAAFFASNARIYVSAVYRI